MRNSDIDCKELSECAGGYRRDAAVVRTDIPTRLDRPPWSRFHSAALRLSSPEIGVLASFYLLGAVVGALVSGWLTDRYGRARLFFITLAIYLAGTLFTVLSWNFAITVSHKNSDQPILDSRVKSSLMLAYPEAFCGVRIDTHNSPRETLIKSHGVIPAKAGIQVQGRCNFAPCISEITATSSLVGNGPLRAAE